jgi:hypothetical protein
MRITIGMGGTSVVMGHLKITGLHKFQRWLGHI